jgi:isopenicillin N synthase-like dioxygenase
MSDIPVIDAAGLRSGRTADVRALGRACRETGFFYLTGHGVATEPVFEAARALFALPVERKAALSIKRSPHNRGYVGLGEERLDERAPPDRKEAFNVGLELPPDDPEVLARKPFRGLNFWPDLPGWRETVLAYYAACQSLSLVVHRGFALDLGIAEDFFASRLDRPMSTLRLLHYPPGPADGAGELGAGEHTDYGNLTVLATDGVAGLQIRRRDGTWLDAPHIAGAFVCNIGDCLMRWTNDLYVSTPHRVVRPRSERYSVAYFADPNPDAVVETIATCVPDAAAAKYAPITAGAYLASRFDATYLYREPIPRA